MWKNLENYKSDIDPNDLDIYISSKNKNKAFRLLEENGWLRLVNPVANYSKIRHYYFFTSTKTYHLHIYTELQTGDSWLKNYIFPFNKFLINNTYQDERNINIINNEAFNLLFTLRTVIKNSTFLGKILYKLSIDKYKKESNIINYNNINFQYVGDLKKEFLDFAQLSNDLQIKVDNIPDILTCKKLLRNFKNYSRINYKSIFLRQLVSFFIRLINKIFLKYNKILKNKAKIITFYGTDGSGKSTIVNNIYQIYKPFFPCSKAHLGKPFFQSKILGSIYSYKNKIEKSERANKNFSFFGGSKTLVLSFLRLISSYYQVIKTYLGITVITDRWPSSTPSTMDGPKIFKNKNKNIFISIFNFLNISIYKLIPCTDMLIILDVDKKYIIERNFKRTDPENLEFIISRYHSKELSTPKSKRFFTYKNNKKLNNAINDCLKIVSSFLNKN